MQHEDTPEHTLGSDEVSRTLHALEFRVGGFALSLVSLPFAWIRGWGICIMDCRPLKGVDVEDHPMRDVT